MDAPDREKVIKALERAKAQSEEYAQDHIVVPFKELDMILALLREQEKERENIVTWIGKFCAHVDQQYQPAFTDEGNTEFFRRKMKEQFGWDVR